MFIEAHDKAGLPAENAAREHFDIHASVVFQLGESLITDSVQELVELVKNCYDADATFCKLNISTEAVSDTASPFKGAAGSITVEDDGNGMNLDSIRRGWLTISNSEKRDFKDKSLETKRGRTPRGDKGLGRLGTQRLGYNLEMFTRSEGSPLVISELREPDLWRGDAVKDLETGLSQFISPYREVRDFVVYAIVDGKELELLEIGEKLRRTAQLRYVLGFDGALFEIKGKARLAYIRPVSPCDLRCSRFHTLPGSLAGCAGNLQASHRPDRASVPRRSLP